jgi:hypothetical protein
LPGLGQGGVVAGDEGQQVNVVDGAVAVVVEVPDVAVVALVVTEGGEQHGRVVGVHGAVADKP